VTDRPPSKDATFDDSDSRDESAEGGRGAPNPTTPGRPARRRERWVILATIVAILVAWWGLLSDRFYYGNDDLYQFLTADTFGLSWETVALPVWQHFGPVNRLAHLGVLRLTDLDPMLGFVLVTISFALLLLTLAWLTTELSLSLYRRLAVLVVVGLSIPVSETGIWFDAGMHILPALTVTYAVLAAHARALRTDSSRWHVLTALIFLVGPLTQERPLFALPMIILMDMLLIWRGLPWRERFSRLWSIRRPLGVLIAIAGMVAVAYRLFVVDSGYGTPDWLTALKTTAISLTNYVLPSLLNQYPGSAQPELGADAPIPLLGQLGIIAGVVVIGYLFIRVDRQNIGPLLFAASAFVLYYGFLKFSPLLASYTIVANASRLHNAVYVTVPVVIAVACLRWTRPQATSPRASSRPPRLSRPPHRVQTGLAPALLAAAAVLLLLTNVGYLEGKRQDASQARQYLDAVRASAPAWSDPEITLVPLYGNPALSTAWSAPYGRHDQLLKLISPGFIPSDLTPNPVIVAADGTVQPVSLTTLESIPLSPVNFPCVAPGEARRFLLTLPAPVRGETLFAQVSYTSATDEAGEITAYGRNSISKNFWPIFLGEGRHTSLIPLDTENLRSISIKLFDPDARVCIDALSVVRPALPPDAEGRCRYVDMYGRPSSLTECPA